MRRYRTDSSPGATLRQRSRARTYCVARAQQRGGRGTDGCLGRDSDYTLFATHRKLCWVAL